MFPDQTVQWQTKKVVRHFHLLPSKRQLYGMLNDPNQAVSELEQAYDAREALMYFIKVDQSLEPLKNNLRYKALLKKMNFN